MYSFRQRTDTTVVDEPLYAHYLRVTGREHPGREHVLSHQQTDGEIVCREVLHGPYETPVVVFKNMAHHWRGLEPRHLDGLTHVFLVREPRDMLASLTVQLPDCDLDATGLPDQVRLLHHLRTQGLSPTVVAAEDLRRRPEPTLSALCRQLGLPFQRRMLRWPAGPKPEDGVWAPWWYERVHQSTGFTPPGAPRPLKKNHRSLLQACVPLHQTLLQHRLFVP